ncbi:MAG: ribonuclease T2 [Acidobacteriaceae bacterium]|nr:ribonuclease T2 [Acidobacteriaceae bacterium]
MHSKFGLRWLLLLTSLGASCIFPQERSARPGDFDYYVLSLSWSPEFCYNHQSSPECSEHYGFIVHGLWPQSRNGYGPEFCSHAPGPADIHSYLRIMPDPGLIRHEWAAHGTCSGLNADAYFALVRQAFESIRIPRPFLAPRSEMRASPAAVVRSFVEANPGLPPAAVELSCRGPYLQGVDICLSKELHPTSCTIRHECRTQLVKIAPVR